MKMFVMRHKKLFIVLLVIVVLLQSLWLFKPKLSTLSDTGLEVFLWLNGIEAPQDMEWTREYIKMVEACSDYLPVCNWTKMLVLPAKINKAVNRYYGRPFMFQNILDEA